jgi:hypothetical protein
MKLNHVGALLSAALLAVVVGESATAQVDCTAIPAGPARTDCYIGLSRIYRQKSEIAAGTARLQSDRAIYRRVTGSHPRSKKSKRAPN